MADWGRSCMLFRLHAGGSQGAVRKGRTMYAAKSYFTDYKRNRKLNNRLELAACPIVGKGSFSARIDEIRLQSLCTKFRIEDSCLFL